MALVQAGAGQSGGSGKKEKTRDKTNANILKTNPNIYELMMN